MSERYVVGQACLNGHKITGQYGSVETAYFCGRCGAQTISSCPSCNMPIRGDLRFEIFNEEMKITAFCYSCGRPYPWTERQVQAAKDLADEVDGIDDAERERAKESFLALTSDTPQTPVAVARVTKLMKKAGPVVGGAIREILVSIATEAAKKGLGI